MATQPNRARHSGIEDSAIAALVAHLIQQGSVAEVVRRPDQELRSRRAVDAELLVDGRLVAVEVTQLVRAARDHVEMNELQTEVGHGMEDLVRDRDLCYVVLSVSYRRLPSRRELRAAAAELRRDIAAAIALFPSGLRERREVAVDCAIAFVRRLEVIHVPSARQGVGWISCSDEFGGWVGALANEFVEHLLASKTSQTAGYGEAWILIVDRFGLVAADDITDALGRAAGDIPSNWSTVWLRPASGDQQLVEIPIQEIRMAALGRGQ